MKKIILLTTSFLVSTISFANDTISIYPVKAIDCAKETNRKAFALYGTTFENKNDKIKLDFSWNYGKCGKLIDGKGHVSKLSNKAGFVQELYDGKKVIDIDELTVNTVQTDSGKYNVTHVSFPASALEISNKFRLSLRASYVIKSDKYFHIEIISLKSGHYSLKVTE